MPCADKDEEWSSSIQTSVWISDCPAFPLELGMGNSAYFYSSHQMKSSKDQFKKKKTY